MALSAGDVIHAVNGRPVASLVELRAALDTLDRHAAVVLQIERDGASTASSPSSWTDERGHGARAPRRDRSVGHRRARRGNRRAEVRTAAGSDGRITSGALPCQASRSLSAPPTRRSHRSATTSTGIDGRYSLLLAAGARYRLSTAFTGFVSVERDLTPAAGSLRSDRSTSSSRSKPRATTLDRDGGGGANGAALSDAQRRADRRSPADRHDAAGRNR